MKNGVIAAVFVLGFVAGGIAQKQEVKGVPPERVTGIGGVFFKAKDPKALAVWYREKLGIVPMEGMDFSIFQWRDKDDTARLGTTVWGLFRADTKYFGPNDKQYMINYRVRDLERMLAQLRALGVTVDGKIEDDFNGRFASVMDPEGNRIQLWEPKAGY